MNNNNNINVCTWIGECGCRKPAMIGKSYCEEHYKLVYDVFYPEMADYVIERGINNESGRSDI